MERLVKEVGPEAAEAYVAHLLLHAEHQEALRPDVGDEAAASPAENGAVFPVVATPGAVAPGDLGSIPEHLGIPGAQLSSAETDQAEL